MLHTPRLVVFGGLLLLAAGIGATSILGHTVAKASAPTTVAAAAATGPRVALRVNANDGRGHRRSASLSCRGSVASGTGYLRARAASACRRARQIAAFLASKPEPRMCTQEYGGPQTARIRGTIGSRAIDRRFKRTDGCEISDWARAGTLLPRP